MKLSIVAVFGIVLGGSALKLPFTPSYTDSKEAVRSHENYILVGEYIAKDSRTALQANMLPSGHFLVAIYQGGLPGAAWDGSKIDSKVMDADSLKTRLSEYTRMDRQSPTLGKAAPKNAALVFPDDFTNVVKGVMMPGGQTDRELESFHMHLEFMLPFKPGRNLSNQDRGNSGIYIFNNYEIQIIDSFGLDLNLSLIHI